MRELSRLELPQIFPREEDKQLLLQERKSFGQPETTEAGRDYKRIEMKITIKVENHRGGKKKFLRVLLSVLVAFGRVESFFVGI